MKTTLIQILFILAFVDAVNAQSMRAVYEMDFLQKHKANDAFVLLAYQIYIEIRSSGGTKHQFYSDPSAKSVELAEALGEYFEIQDEMIRVANGTPEGKQQWDKLNEKCRDFEEDRSFAELAMKTMGVDRCIFHARKLTKSRLERLSGAEKIVRVNSVLGSTRLHEVLGFDENQRARTKQVISDQQELVAEKVNEVLRKLSRHSTERWQSLLRCLPEKQSEIVRLRFGEPIEWFRYRLKPKWLESIADPRTGACVGGYWYQGKKLAEILSGKPPHSFSEAELSELGVMPISPICLSLLSQRSVWHELDATEEQSDLKNLFSKQARDIGYCIAEKDNSRFVKLLGGFEPEYRCFDGMLPHQKKRLAEMEIQIRCSKRFLATVGLTHPVVVEHFEFSRDLVKELEAIGKSYSEKEKELLAVVEKIRGEGHAELRSYLAEVLTPEQHEKYYELMGEKLAADVSEP